MMREALLGLILGLTTAGCGRLDAPDVIEYPGFRSVRNPDGTRTTYEQWIVDWHRTYPPEVIEREILAQQRDPEFIAWERDYENNRRAATMERAVNNARGNNPILWFTGGYLFGRAVR